MDLQELNMKLVKELQRWATDKINSGELKVVNSGDASNGLYVRQENTQTYLTVDEGVFPNYYTQGGNWESKPLNSKRILGFLNKGNKEFWLRSLDFMLCSSEKKSTRAIAISIMPIANNLFIFRRVNTIESLEMVKNMIMGF